MIPDPDAGGVPTGKPKRKGTDGEIYEDFGGKRYRCSTYYRGGKEISTWYEIDASGSRIIGGTVRPPDTPVKVWSKMSEAQQLADIADYTAGRPGKKAIGEGKDNAASGAVLPKPNGLPGVPASSSSSSSSVCCRSRCRRLCTYGPLWS